MILQLKFQKKLRMPLLQSNRELSIVLYRNACVERLTKLLIKYIDKIIN